MENSRRDLLNDMSEHILKNYQNKYHPRFVFNTKTGKRIPKTGFWFLLRIILLNFYPKKS